MSNPTPARRLRRWWKVLGVALIAALVLVAALPWLIASGPFRARVSSGLNQAMAPGRIEFEGLSVSWFGPTRLDRVILLDPRGETVLKANSLVFDRTLGQLLLRDRNPAVLTIDGGSLEVERSDDGTLNIAEALRTLIANPDPKRDVTIRIVNGMLRYQDPFLVEPAVAESLDVTIRAPYAPGPVTWSAKFGHGDASLECQGDFDAWLSRGGLPKKPELQIGVVSKHWPFVVRTAGVNAVGRLDGSLDFARKRGRWVLSGDARLEGFNARGKNLWGDTLVFEKCEAGWDLAEGEEGWKIRRLSATTPLGQIKAEGQLNGPNGSGKQRIEGQIDLAEIARQLPHALHLRDGLTVERGTARISVDLASALGQTTCDIEARVSDLAARDKTRELSLNDPATFQTRLVRKGDESIVERLSVHTSFLDASAKGSLEQGVTLAGTVDLGGLRKQLGDWVDLAGLDLAGRAELAGTYKTFTDATHSLQRYQNNLTATIQDLRLDGAGPWSIRRDLATVEFTAVGPSAASGQPEGWFQLLVKGRSGKSELGLNLESTNGPTRVQVVASLPVQVGDRTRMASLDLTGDWTAGRRILAIDHLGAFLDRVDQPDRKRLRLLAKGKLDLSSGELTLEPQPGEAPGALTIDPEGLRVAGIGQGLEALRFVVGVSGELASLDDLLADATGRSPLGLTGRWSALGNARGDADGLNLAGKFGLDDPPGPSARASRPTSLAFRAHYSPRSDRLGLSEFTLTTPYGTLDASGTLEAATGDRVVDLKGLLSPDFGAINALLASRVEPGARVFGKPRAFRASGPLGGIEATAWKRLDAEVGFDLAGADIYGMKFGPQPGQCSGPIAAGWSSTRSARRSTRGTSGLSPRSTSTRLAGRPFDWPRTRTSARPGSTMRSRSGSSPTWLRFSTRRPGPAAW